ncbi:MAG: response regulator [Verrucomicrobiales bacterium]
MTATRETEILLVDDNLGDVILTKEALKGAQFHSRVSVASDGVEAMEFLRHQGRFADAPRPDLVFLDLNMPRKNGAEVLAEMKADPDLRLIPVVILTSSEADDDIANAYHSHANCYVSKPTDLDEMIKVVQSIQNFWLSVVRLPPLPR